MQDQKSSSSPQTFKTQHHKLIQYLDDFGRQISHRKTNSHTLEQQLSSLSRAYNQAQEKLLETEKALMSESILLEKQRTVIEIYKHIIRQNMEDEGILSFIQTLEEDEAKNDIYEELEELKNILNRKRLNNYKKNMEDDRAMKQLKKQISRLYEERNSICDESELIQSENYQLKLQFEENIKQNKMLKDQLQKLREAFAKMEQELKNANAQIFKLKGQIDQNNDIVKSYEKNDKAANKFQVELAEINAILAQKLSLITEDFKENLKDISNEFHHRQPKESPRHFLNQLDSKLSQLLKYKQKYKKLKEQQQNNQFIKKQLSILKLFLSDEALNLVKQLQEKKIDCIESQLRNLAVIEKNKLIRLEECERDVWKYKLQLLREEETSNSYIPNIYLTQSLQPNSCKSGDHFRPLTQPIIKELGASTNPCRSVSEFISEQ